MSESVIHIFWVVTLCSLVDRTFRRYLRLHLLRNCTISHGVTSQKTWVFWENLKSHILFLFWSQTWDTDAYLLFLVLPYDRLILHPGSLIVCLNGIHKIYTAEEAKARFGNKEEHQISVEWAEIIVIHGEMWAEVDVAYFSILWKIGNRLKFIIFCDAEMYQRFWRTYYLHLQGRTVSDARN
jgi:hypothetical protein